MHLTCVSLALQDSVTSQTIDVEMIVCCKLKFFWFGSYVNKKVFVLEKLVRSFEVDIIRNYTNFTVNYFCLQRIVLCIVICDNYLLLLRNLTTISELMLIDITQIICCSDWWACGRNVRPTCASWNVV